MLSILHIFNDAYNEITIKTSTKHNKTTPLQDTNTLTSTKALDINNTITDTTLHTTQSSNTTKDTTNNNTTTYAVKYNKHTTIYTVKATTNNKTTTTQYNSKQLLSILHLFNTPNSTTTTQHNTKDNTTNNSIHHSYIPHYSIVLTLNNILQYYYTLLIHTIHTSTTNTITNTILHAITLNSNSTTHNSIYSSHAYSYITPTLSITSILHNIINTLLIHTLTL